jgi:hypothetical protein
MDDKLTLRAYFAARAPKEIPDWFQIKDLRPAPKLPNDKWLSESRPSMHTAWMLQWSDLQKGYKSEGEVDLEVLAHHRRYVAAEAELHAWQVEHDKERYYAWRWAFADDMMARQR